MVFEMWDGYIPPSKEEISERKKHDDDKIFSDFRKAVTELQTKAQAKRSTPRFTA